MQQRTTRQLYAYWDTIRNGRIAPCRSEIEPSKISGLLRETFIAERSGPLSFCFRLAGPRVCHQFCRELRGLDFLNFWSTKDRHAVAAILRNVVNDGAVGHGTFLARSDATRETDFEFALLPLIHRGSSIDRILGSITAIDPPFWLGIERLTAFDVTTLHLHRPGSFSGLTPDTDAQGESPPRRKFRVLEGGLSRSGKRKRAPPPFLFLRCLALP